MIILKKQSFDSFLDLSSLEKAYQRVRTVHSIGRDGISISKFDRIQQSEFEIIIKKIKDKNYTFTAYGEKLLPKSFDRNPRRIAIPTIRDKVLLRAIKSYLERVLPEVENPKHQLYYIKNIKDLSLDNKYFIRTDISKYYDSIPHNRLLDMIKSKISDEYLINLIRKAINNHITPFGDSNPITYRTVGIPQGLSISNILANIYLYSIDTHFKNESYFRYMDDIIIFTDSLKTSHQYKANLEELTQELGLCLNKQKTVSGERVSSGFEFLGYTYSVQEDFSIKSSSLQRQYSIITRMIRNLKNNLIYKTKPPYETPRDILIKKFLSDINQIIAGAIYEDKKYGFMFYFSEIDNIGQLYGLDNFVKREIKKVISDKNHIKQIKKHVKAYFSWKTGSFKDYCLDYDSLTIKEKLAYLQDTGKINNSDSTLSEETINRLFENTIRPQLRALSNFSGIIY